MTVRPLDNAALHGQYPFLHAATPREAARFEASLADAARHSAEQHAAVVQEFFNNNRKALIAAAHAIADSCRRGGRILTMGDGACAGAAAQAAIDFVVPAQAGRPALPAIELAAGHAAVRTAAGYDGGSDQMFVRPLLAHARRGDVLLGYAARGDCRQLLAAFAKARELGVATVGFAGHDGGPMAAEGHLDHCLVVRSDDDRRVLETQILLHHVVYDMLHAILAASR